MSKVELIISHAEDQKYLNHCLNIIKSLEVFNDIPIKIDGYNTICEFAKTDDRISSVTTHREPHGGRCFDLLNQSTADVVIIMDSDFFCNDESFWERILEEIENNTIVSIEQNWHHGIKIASTPLCAYRRKEILDLVNFKDLWEHFATTHRNLKEPIFDSIKFVYMAASIHKGVCLIDSWNSITDKNYKFYHFWDSRHTHEQNFNNYVNCENKNDKIYKYLGRGVSKYIFDYIINEKEFDPVVWDYMDDIFEWGKTNSKQSIHILYDCMHNLPSQLINEKWTDKMKIISDTFFKKYGHLHE